MAEWTMTWTGWREFKDDVRPGREAIAKGQGWPRPAEGIVRVLSAHWPKYAIDVELRLDGLDEPVVTGVAVRPLAPMEAKGQRATFEHVAEWPKDSEPVALSLRDARRLPLDRVATAAVVLARQYMEEPSPDRMQPVAEALSLPGRPTGRNKEQFYSTVAKLTRMWIAEGRSPAKELARRKRVSINTAHQWIFKARKLGYLEPSSRRRLRHD